MVLRVSLSMSIHVPIHMSLCIYIPHVYALSTHMSVPISMHIPMHISMHMSVHMSVHASTRMFIHMYMPQVLFGQMQAVEMLVKFMRSALLDREPVP